MTIDEAMLAAFIDGELDEIGRARVEQAAQQDLELRRRIDAGQRLRARIADHYAPVADETVPDRLCEILGANVVNIATISTRRRRFWQSAVALAATLVLGLFVGRSLPGEGPATFRDGALIARGDLATALDSQLASAQPPDAPTQIGISFASTEGSLCRSFERESLAGLACRTDSGWQLVVTAPAGDVGGTGYRQAGSLQIMSLAQEMMAGEAFDVESERRARDSGWRARPAAR